VARRARAGASTRRRHESPGPAPEPAAPHADPLEQLTVRELLTALEEEVQRLPEAYRLPVVLCCLEGLSQEEAARRLLLTPAAVRARLERGRKRLRAQLARRGLVLSAALAVAEVSRGFGAGVPAPLAQATAQAALLTAAGDAAAAVPANVAFLTKGVLRAMLLKKLRAITAVVLSLALVGLGVGALTHPSPGARAAGAETGGPAVPARETPAGGGQGAKSLPDDPMPTPALVRVDDRGRLVVRHKVRTYQYNVRPGGRGLGPAERITVLQASYFGLGDARVFDTGGKEVDRKSLPGLLKKEVLGVVYFVGQKVDPRHLRLLKEGTLVFSVPLPAPPPAPAGDTPALPDSRPPASDQVAPVSPPTSEPRGERQPAPAVPPTAPEAQPPAPEPGNPAPVPLPSTSGEVPPAP
jgi:hypothetical protein